MIAVRAARVSGFRSLGLASGLAVVLGVLAGCPRPPLVTERRPPPDAGPQRPSVFFATNRNVDLLFLIDDSSSMRLSQDNLRRNFPVLMRQLQNLPGGLPNIHVAVVSSDMGAGDGSISGCDTAGGDNGIFQFAPRGACATGLAPGATYISNVGGVPNYTGALEDVFSCIAALGQAGCGFEHQFAAVTRALGVDGRGAAPAENQGFLRADALLAIVMITNEDDCSATPGVRLYDTTVNTNIASQLGPPANFRCNEFGHLCDGRRPDRRAPGNDVNASVTYADCVSDDEGGYLLGVRDTADRIKSLKGDDGQILLAAITGPAAPYVVRWKAPTGTDASCGAASCPWPEIAPSCTAADGSFGDPAVRIAELVGEFGETGRLVSICDDDFAPALADVADRITHYVSAPCIVGRIARRAGTTRDDCTVTNADTGAAVPACDDTGGAGACWRLADGGPTCSGVSVVVNADPQTGGEPPGNLTIRCTMCVPGAPDPTVGCP